MQRPRPPRALQCKGAGQLVTMKQTRLTNKLGQLFKGMQRRSGTTYIRVGLAQHAGTNPCRPSCGTSEGRTHERLAAALVEIMKPRLQLDGGGEILHSLCICTKGACDDMAHQTAAAAAAAQYACPREVQ